MPLLRADIREQSADKMLFRNKESQADAGPEGEVSWGIAELCVRQSLSAWVCESVLCVRAHAPVNGI